MPPHGAFQHPEVSIIFITSTLDDCRLFAPPPAFGTPLPTLVKEGARELDVTQSTSGLGASHHKGRLHRAEPLCLDSDDRWDQTFSQLRLKYSPQPPRWIELSAVVAQK